MASGALAYAQLKRAEVVFCGHTHEAMQAGTQRVRYFNAGCWTSETPTYITVGESGIAIHNYLEEEMAREVTSRVVFNACTPEMGGLKKEGERVVCMQEGLSQLA